jgi:hypothetical protein
MFEHGAIVMVEAHPYLISSSNCDAPHPTTRRHAHGAPSEDASITFLVQWTNPEGSNAEAIGEDNPERVIPESWSVRGNKYCKSCRMTLTVRHTDQQTYKELVTVSHGSFLEQGRNMDGNTNYGAGTKCDGKRYDAGFESNVHHYIWTAPNSDVGPITLKVTGASGSANAFKYNSVTLTYDQSIKEAVENEQPPAGPPGAASPPPMNHFDGLSDDQAVHGSQGKSDALKVIVAHGGIMLFSWIVFPPLLLYAGRFKESIFGKHWFRVHKYTVTIMSVFVLIALILANRYRVETRGRLAKPMQTRHGIAGSITVFCWFVQPIIAYFRPPKFLELGEGVTTKANPKRTAWMWMHRTVAMASVLFSIFAVRTGLNEHDPEMTFGEEAIEEIWNLNFLIVYVVFAYILIPILLEVLSRKRGKHTTRQYSHMELEMGDVEDDDHVGLTY